MYTQPLHDIFRWVDNKVVGPISYVNVIGVISGLLLGLFASQLLAFLPWEGVYASSVAIGVVATLRVQGYWLYRLVGHAVRFWWVERIQPRRHYIGGASTVLEVRDDTLFLDLTDLEDNQEIPSFEGEY